MNCKNCGQEVAGNFCAYCGQSTDVRRVNRANIMKDLSEGVFQMNRGFLYTMKELFRRPGHSIREYLNGKRKPHFKPIAYVFTLSTIYFLMSRTLDTDTFMNQFVEGFSDAASDSEASVIKVMNRFAENYAYTMLLLLPLYALSTWIAFRKSGYNYLEHFILNAYITGQQALFYMFALLSITLFGGEDVSTFVVVTLSVLYTVFVFIQFFHRRSRIEVVLRSVLTYVLYLIFFGTFIILGLLPFMN